jgi:hypothetical protein
MLPLERLCMNRSFHKILFLVSQTFCNVKTGIQKDSAFASIDLFVTMLWTGCKTMIEVRQEEKFQNLRKSIHT